MKIDGSPSAEHLAECEVALGDTKSGRIAVAIIVLEADESRK